MHQNALVLYSTQLPYRTGISVRNQTVRPQPPSTLPPKRGLQMSFVASQNTDERNRRTKLNKTNKWKNMLLCEREREREGKKRQTKNKTKHGLLFHKAPQNTKCFLLRPEAVLSNIFHPAQPETTERNPFYHNQLAYRTGDDYISASISIQTFSSRWTTHVPERNKIPDVL